MGSPDRSQDDHESFLVQASEPLVHTLSRAPEPERRCHDVGPLIVFILYWSGMLAIALMAVQEGDYRRLIDGMDDHNQLCGGADTELESRPYVYYACLQYGSRRPTVCVSQCPSLSGHYVRWYNGTMIHCDAHGRVIPATTYPTTHLRYSCVPSAATLYGLVASIIDVNGFTSIITGMLLAWRDVLRAAIAAGILALVWMLAVGPLARRKILAPTTILLSLGSLAFLAISLWARANYLTSEEFADDMPVLQGSLQVAMNTDMSLALAIITTAFAFAVAVALWCGLGDRLLQAGGILREAAEATRMMPSLLFLLPPLLIFLLVLLFGYWLAISVLLASAGHPAHGHMRYNRSLQWLFVYHTLGLLWTAEIVLHLGFCASAGAVARWYFASAESPTSASSSSSSSTAVGFAILRALRYSSGSLALGSALVIPGRIFRFFLEHCLHQAQTDGRGKPELRGVAQCCLRCCLDCSTRYLQYISHNAYIYVAVHDLSFCEGAKQAFELTMRNIGQVAVLTAGERLLLTMAKLAVACTCTAFTCVALSVQDGYFTALDNANGALFLTFVFTFCVADAWMAVYDSAAEAVFLCYLVDQEENDGDLRPYYASATLRKYMERHKPTYKLPAITPEGSREERGLPDVVLDEDEHVSGVSDASEPAVVVESISSRKGR